LQVVAASQGLAGNIRTHVTNQQTLTGVPGTIKLASNTIPQQQQAILNVLQQNQRQNTSPVRLQTSSSNLMAVTVQQQPNIVVSSARNVVMSGEQKSGLQKSGLQILQLQQHQQQQQQTIQIHNTSGTCGILRIISTLLI
jgi:hypothetical protein